jgi:hypothetical protein
MPPFVNDLFDHSQTMLQAELDWVNSWILKHETGRETE